MIFIWTVDYYYYHYYYYYNYNIYKTIIYNGTLAIYFTTKITLEEFLLIPLTLHLTCFPKLQATLFNRFIMKQINWISYLTMFCLDFCWSNDTSVSKTDLDLKAEDNIKIDPKLFCNWFLIIVTVALSGQQTLVELHASRM